MQRATAYGVVVVVVVMAAGDGGGRAVPAGDGAFQNGCVQERQRGGRGGVEGWRGGGVPRHTHADETHHGVLAGSNGAVTFGLGTRSGVVIPSVAPLRGGCTVMQR